MHPLDLIRGVSPACQVWFDGFIHHSDESDDIVERDKSR
jgi:hypothetical protein